MKKAALIVLHVAFIICLFVTGALIYNTGKRNGKYEGEQIGYEKGHEDGYFFGYTDGRRDGVKGTVVIEEEQYIFAEGHLYKVTSKRVGTK